LLELLTLWGFTRLVKGPDIVSQCLSTSNVERRTSNVFLRVKGSDIESQCLSTSNVERRTSNVFSRLIYQLFQSFALALWPAVGVYAQETWTVPSIPLPLEISFSGQVVTDSAKRETMLPSSDRCSIRWLAMFGSRVEAGDVVAAFDTTPIAKSIPDLEAALVVAERSLLRDDLAQQNALAVLEDARDGLEVERKVLDATLEALRHPEPAKLALLKSTIEQIERQIQDLDRQLKRNEPMFEAGIISGLAMQEQRDRLVRMRLNLKGPQADWERAQAGPNKPWQAQLVARRAEILAKLGCDDQGRMLHQAGILARIAALKTQGERQHAANQIEVEQVRRNLHRAVRDVRDQTPLLGVEIASLGPGGAVRRWSFQPVGTPDISSWTADHGDRYEGRRGFGWITEAQGLFASRHQKPELGCGVAVLHGRHIWRTDLPDGDYRITVTLGDEYEWDGAVVRLRLRGREHPAFLVARRIEAKARLTASAVVTVTDGMIELVFGGAVDKAIRASRSGVVTIPEWVRVGARIEHDHWPVAYFNDPRLFQVRGRALQTVAGFLTARPESRPAPTLSADPTDPSRIAALAALRTWSATNQAEVLASGGRRLQATIVQRSSQAVAAQATTDWGRADPLDRIANEVLLQPPEDQASQLAFGEQVVVVARPRLPVGMTVVPGWLVAHRDGRCWIRRAGHAVEEVAGMPVGDRVALAVALPPGTRLVPAMAPAAEKAAIPRFPGEVVAGLRTPVTVPYYWGRIAVMAEEGSRVVPGQVVVELVNPDLERSREDRQQEKTATRERFLLGNDKRRVQALEAEERDRLLRVAEVTARIEVVRALERDPVAEARALARREDAAIVQVSASRRRQALIATEGIPAVKREAAERQEKQARIDEQAATLAVAMSQRSIDWLALQTARQVWSDSQEVLDLREGRLLLAARQEQIAAQTAALGLTAALDHDRQEQLFESIRHLRAPVGGRIFFLTGWDDQTNGPAKFRRDMVVWGGVTVAEILDFSRLQVRCELPEDRFGHIRQGMRLTVILPQLGSRRIEGEVSEVGRFLRPPREAAADRGTGRVVSERSFTVTVAFKPPDDLKNVLIPGTKAQVEVP
jgi:hypothetical protein